MLTAVLGVVLGVGWVMLTGAVVARSYGVGLGAAVVGMRMLRDGIGVPLGGVILMLMPAVIVRAAATSDARIVGRLHDRRRWARSPSPPPRL